MKSPLVSVLIPVYNAADYLRQCLDSIVGQTYANLQVVLVDDGSTDASGKICDEYAYRYKSIEVYHIPNGGVANARNTLLSKIKGEYFLFVDADDWIEPDMIENLVGLALSYNLDIVVCDSIVENGNSHQKLVRDTNPPTIWDRRRTIEKFLRHKEINGSLWNKLIKTGLFQNVKFDPEISYGEDALAVWHSLHALNQLGISHSTFYHYRMNNGSISHQPFDAKKMSSHKVWKIIAEETGDAYPELKDLAKANFAVADFWLLFFAALDGYGEDNKIAKYRRNLRSQLSIIRQLHLLNCEKIVVAAGMVCSYSLTAFLLRKIYKKKI